MLKIAAKVLPGRPPASSRWRGAQARTPRYAPLQRALPCAFDALQELARVRRHPPLVASSKLKLRSL